MSGFLTELHNMGFKDVGTIPQLLNSEVKGVQDDNKFLLENLVSLLSRLDTTPKLSNQFDRGFHQQSLKCHPSSSTD
jgi:linoleate 8R-lipoxygenase/9,12-octadecadienoate 8-hydroperoxide 8R-isomerase